MNAIMICKCCDKEYIVTDLDFVNEELSYVEDDERCRMNHTDFRTLKSLKINGVELLGLEA
jgi:hypothetical protein